MLCEDGIAATDFQHYDVLLQDAAPMGLHAASGDHDPGAPAYEHVVRPCQPLRVFQGERSAGDWTLRICDMNPAADDGQYLVSRLELTPRDSAAKSARWSHRTPALPDSDWVNHTISIYAEDVVGNRTADGLSMVITVDTQAPVITVTQAVTEIVRVIGGVQVQRVDRPDVMIGTQTAMARDVETVLWGTVSEAGPVVRLSAHVHAPGGSAHRQQAARSGDGWWVDLEVLQDGLYTVWLEAADQAGNRALAGPLGITVTSPAQPPSVPVGGAYLLAARARLLWLRAALLAALVIMLCVMVAVALDTKRGARTRKRTH